MVLTIALIGAVCGMAYRAAQENNQRRLEKVVMTLKLLHVALTRWTA